MVGGRVAALVAALVALALATSATAGGPGMTIGAVEDAAKWGDPVAKMDLARQAGFKAVRMTMQWSSGMTAPSAGELQNTRSAADAARLAGIEPIVAIYNTGSSSTPADDASRAQFVQFATAVVSGLPSVQRFVVGNEPNLNRYWMPQFNADGTDAATPAYLALLAACYDAIKGARPDAIVLGGALSPRGEDSPTSTRPTHSPTVFIQDLGTAYRASGRAAPIMDVWDQHVYEDYSAMPPSFEHPNSKTIAVSDYGKLVSLLGQAFDGTAQAGSTLPIFYGEYGVESLVPAAKASLYAGTEPTATKAVDEATQAALYEEAFKVAYCQPNVVGLMLFHVSDESALSAWQSGPFYADDTPKSSLGRIRDAAAASRAGTLTSCPDTTAPTVAVTSPANGASVRGTVTLTATAGDDVGVGKVEWLVNGAVLAGKAVAPYTFDWSSGASGPVTITARALDAARNAATSTVTVTVDNTPPETTLTATPAGVSSETATFQFVASETGATFECSLDGGAYAPCLSPKTYTGLVPGAHMFSVRSVDAVGNADATPASYSWTVVDTTPPETTITAGPSGTMTSINASFEFTASEAATFDCVLDGAASATCTSPQSYSGLGNGTHTFSVAAKDAAGNVDPTPATRTWTISQAPPNDLFASAQVVSGPSGSVTGTNTSATKEPGEPTHAGNAGGRSVWYRWTCPSTRAVTFETVGSSFNTLLAVYRGTSVSALARVASNDDIGSGVYQSRIKFTGYAGVTYLFAVDGHNGATGSLKLAWH
jgi:Bacterial Ig domain/Cellulase (glycosyl hydrolase family 5)